MGVSPAICARMADLMPSAPISTSPEAVAPSASFSVAPRAFSEKPVTLALSVMQFGSSSSTLSSRSWWKSARCR
jgi:hypothetical protein